MRQLTYRIHGMDCAEEVAALRASVGKLPGMITLRFAVLEGKMTADFDEAAVSDEEIRASVTAAGLRAEAWSRPAQTPTVSRSKQARLLLCLLSGVFLAAGFTLHAVRGAGILEALSGRQGFPPATMLLYGLAAVCGAWFVLPKAVLALRARRADMNLLMTVATTGAMAIGEWFEAAAVMFLFSLSLVLEAWSVGRARHAIQALMTITPATAHTVCPHDGDITETRIEEIGVGSLVRVRPSERIPLDGVVTAGRPTINQAPITGESIPVVKQEGEAVFAGTINEDRSFDFTTTRPAGDTTLAHIRRLIEEAQSNRAPAEQWVEKFARIYTPAVMFLALAVAVVPPLLFGDWSRWLYQAMVMLVIACPCALVISTPVSILSGLASAARAGMLIKGGGALEAAGTLKVIAMDKTGTITHGIPEVQDIYPFNGHTREDVLARAAALESSSGHPLARAILRMAKRHKLTIEQAVDTRDIRGKGAEASLGGRNYWIGSHRFMHEKGAESGEVHEQAVAIEDAAHTLVALGSEDHVCGLISIADPVRDDAPTVVRALHGAGIERIVMLTGDNLATAEAVGALAGIDDIHAQLMPEDKLRIVKQLAERHGQVAMVGDGVNDAPAMAAATLGIAMGAAGSDAAIETADIALMSDDLSRLPLLIGHSRRTTAIIRQNVVFALGVKAIFMLLALGGLATLWMAIAADMGASLLVIFNALRLLRLDETPRSQPDR